MKSYLKEHSYLFAIVISRQISWTFLPCMYRLIVNDKYHLKNIGAFPCCSEMTSTRFKYDITKLLDFIQKQKMNEYEVSHLYQAKVQLLLSSLQSSQKEKIWVTSCHARVCTQKTKLGSVCHLISKVVYLKQIHNKPLYIESVH